MRRGYVGFFLSAFCLSGVSNAQNRPESRSFGGEERRVGLPAIEVRGHQLLVEQKPFVMSAICWNPVRKGQMHPDGLMFRNPSPLDLQTIEQDFQMMRAIGINTLRTYEPIYDERVLALVERYDLYLIVPALNYYATPKEEIEKRILRFKDYPRTLLWEIGNEWNYNQFYSQPQSPIGYEGSRELVQRTAAFIRQLDRRIPISTVHGELPSKALVESLAEVDLWGLNVYSGLSFGERLNQWRNISTKPMYFGEYGADAINRDRLDENAQAEAVVRLKAELEQNLSAKDPQKVALGGAIFEWNDEWWKDASGRPDVQDIGGIAPGGGPHPDQIFNEEFWGLVDIDRKPRRVYQELLKRAPSSTRF
jgi:hypothetical protein